MTLDLAQALLFCELPREEIPPLAAELLESGTDTRMIRELAGLTGSELSQAHDLLRRVLLEMQPMSSRNWYDMQGCCLSELRAMPSNQPPLPPAACWITANRDS